MPNLFTEAETVGAEMHLERLKGPVEFAQDERLDCLIDRINITLEASLTVPQVRRADVDVTDFTLAEIHTVMIRLAELGWSVSFTREEMSDGNVNSILLIDLSRLVCDD